MSILWLVGDLVRRNKADNNKQHLTLVQSLSRIDMGSIVFFVGNVMRVSGSAQGAFCGRGRRSGPATVAGASPVLRI
jgi:hypothetical protein